MISRLFKFYEDFEATSPKKLKYTFPEYLRRFGRNKVSIYVPQYQLDYNLTVRYIEGFSGAGFSFKRKETDYYSVFFSSIDSDMLELITFGPHHNYIDINNKYTPDEIDAALKEISEAMDYGVHIGIKTEKEEKEKAKDKRKETRKNMESQFPIGTIVKSESNFYFEVIGYTNFYSLKLKRLTDNKMFSFPFDEVDVYKDIFETLRPE